MNNSDLINSIFFPRPSNMPKLIEHLQGNNIETKIS